MTYVKLSNQLIVSKKNNVLIVVLFPFTGDREGITLPEELLKRLRQEDKLYEKGIDSIHSLVLIN